MLIVRPVIDLFIDYMYVIFFVCFRWSWV